MIRQIKFIHLYVAALLVMLGSCKKTEYNFGDLKVPSGLTLDAVVTGVDANNPNGDGSGKVAITVNAANAITYKMDFGDGFAPQMVPSGVITYKYATPGLHSYTINVTAVGTGGALSVISKTINVQVNFEIPADMLTDLTNGSSQVWVCDKETGGHFGVGPVTDFSPIWYAADPNSRQPCAYDDEITFTKAANGVDMTLDNKGQSFIIGAAAAFYSLPAAEDCKDIAGGGTKRLVFSDATSASTPANSTRIQFTVPGNGLLIFGTGATTYEILSISPTQMHLRNIGADGNAWYQKLRVKQ